MQLHCVELCRGVTSDCTVYVSSHVSSPTYTVQLLDSS